VKRLCAILVCFGCCFTALAAEVIPPAPAQYFNDYANVVSPQVVSQLNQQLEDFERQTSEQIVVAVYPKMESDSSIEDYTVRVFRSWHVGQKDKNNGAALFVFIQDRKMYLQTGYGLEGVLPDVLCKRIIAEQIAPRFKAGDYNGGLTAGVQSIIAATKGEYRGTGRTVNESRHGVDFIHIIFIIGFFALIILSMARPRRHGWFYSSGGWYGGGWGGGWGGGGGGFSGGGGGGFSGGGGSGGGGGAGGSW
jgi:uncharacterized protein